MSTEIELHQERRDSFSMLAPAAEIANTIANTSFVPDTLRNKPAEVLACILTGVELGIEPMQSLSKIHIVKGRPTLAAELMRALVFEKGHEIGFNEQTTTRCTVWGRRVGSQDTTTVTWTKDDAVAAGLASKDNWKSYPRAMLQARATGELCRLIFPDVLAGISYTPEEIEDGDFMEASLTPEEKAEAKGEVKKKLKAASSKPSTRKTAEPAVREAPPEPPLPGEEEGQEAVVLTEDAETTDSPEPEHDEEFLKNRSRTISIRCNKAKIDRHALVQAVTLGRTKSSKQLTDGEVPLIMQAIIDIEKGRRTLEEGPNGWAIVDQVEGLDDLVEDEDDEIVDAEIVAETDDDDPETWNADDWRHALGEKKVKVTDLLREAAKIAKVAQISPPPGTLNALAGSGLCAELEEWLNDLSVD